MHWPRNILDPLVPLVLEPVGQLIADLVPCYPRDADPARLRKGLQPRRDIDSITEEIIALNQDVPDVDADAEPHLLIGLFLRILLGYGVLHRDSTLRGTHGAREIGDQTVTSRAENPTAMRGDEAIDDDPVGRERSKGTDLIPTHEGAVAGDIGGENRGELPFDGMRFQGSGTSRFEYSSTGQKVRGLCKPF